jgi:hypothetical protein
VKDLKIAQIWELDMPKDTNRLKAFRDFDHTNPGEVNRKYNRTRTLWSQGNDHMILITEFTNAEDYTNFMKDDEAQRYCVDFSRLVDNVKVRTCRPAIFSYPE